MESTIFKFIRRYSMRQQTVVLLMTAVSWPILYITLELPKIIINEAIGGTNFPTTVMGFEFEQIRYLLALCFAFLILVVLTGAVKYYLNVYAGRLGERMLRRLRYQLYARILRFPLPQFKRVSQGEIIPMITAEVEPVGGFIGEAFSTPAFMGGMLTVYLGFILAQDLILGAAACVLPLVQAIVIPRLQRRVVMLGKERIRNVRYLADRVGETISGITEVHAHDASALARADVTRRLDRIYNIRYEIFRRKFFIKFLNNFLNQLTPFFFYSIGGYLVIQKQITLGALVAVLAAYKDLASPLKELLRYYQTQSDVGVKYQQVVEQFQPPDMLDAELQLAEPKTREPLGGNLDATNVTFSEDGRVKSVEGASFSMELDRHTAIVGPGGSGKEDFTLLLARLLAPTQGSLRIAGKRMDDLPEAVTGRQITYVSATPYIFSTSVRENLFYGLKHRPVHPKDYDEVGKKRRAQYVADAKFADNSTHDFEANWVDYEAAGVTSMEALDQKAIETLVMVDMGDDIYQLGLRGTIDPRQEPDLAAKVLRARGTLQERLVDQGMGDLVEPFDESRYNENATLGENLLFGTPRDKTFDVERLAENEYVQEVVKKAGLADNLLAMGRTIAETMVELFSGLPPGHEFFDQYSFIASDELPDYQALLARAATLAPDDMQDKDRLRLLSLPFKLISARHRLDLIDAAMKNRLIAARKLFADELPDRLRGAIEFFDSDRYNDAATLQDNILFGKVAYGEAQSAAKLSGLIGEVLDELNLRRAVMEVGLQFDVGVAGARLTSAQRQKLGIARCILKRPDLLILSEAITSLDGAAQTRVLDAVLKEFKGRGVIWGLHRARYAEAFDKVLVMRGGKIVEQGSFKNLKKDGTVLAELLQSE